MPAPEKPRRRVLVIGWDGADWEVATPLIKAGRMPHLAKLVSEGAAGNLATLRPCLTPMLWTSVATGYTADRHGILGFVEPSATGDGVVPSRSTSRLSPAVWTLLADEGLRSCVVAWPVSDPPEAIPGVIVSERILDGLASHLDGISPPTDDLVHPPGYATAHLAEACFHPCELAPEDLRDFIPDVSRIDLTADARPEMLARHYARCASIHSLATQILAAEDWDFAAVYYETLDRVGHDFMSYRPPLMAGVDPADMARYGGVVDAMYAFHDAMLGALLEIAGPETQVILLSDHGFQSGPARPPWSPPAGLGIAESGADWHRPLGVLAMHGPGIAAGVRLHGATLLDILPTVLHCFRLRAAQDLPGAVLQRAFTGAPYLLPRLPITPPTHPTRTTADSIAPVLERATALRQLVDLGYLAASSLTGAQAAVQAVQEAQFNLACVHLHHHRPTHALPLLEKLCAEIPLLPRYELARLECLQALHRPTEILTHLSRLKAAGLSGPTFDLAAASAHFVTGDSVSASRCLDAARTARPDDPAIACAVGELALRSGQTDAALQHYQSALTLHPGHPMAHAGLAACFLKIEDPAQSLDHAVLSLQQIFWNPPLHWIMAQALAALGEYPRARASCLQALLQAPNFTEARTALQSWPDS